MRCTFPGYLYHKSSWRFPFEFTQLGYQKTGRSSVNVVFMSRAVHASDVEQALCQVSGVEDAKLSSRTARWFEPLVFHAEVHGVTNRATVSVTYPQATFFGDAVNVPPGLQGIQKAEQSALIRYIRNNPRLFASELERCRLADELRAELGE